MLRTHTAGRSAAADAVTSPTTSGYTSFGLEEDLERAEKHDEVQVNKFDLTEQEQRD